MDSLPVHVAVLTIADDAATVDRAVARAITERATSAGHQIVDEEVVKDAESAIRDQLVRWIAEPNIDVVIVAASSESASASAALAPLVMQTLPGFTDLFRWLTFQEIGASAMQSTAEAAQCESTFVFVLPAHEGAVRAAMDKLILPQLDARTLPTNLVTQMPRLKDAAKRFQAEAKSQPVAVPAVKPDVAAQPMSESVASAFDAITSPVELVTAPVEAVPTVIASEKTVGGSGLPPKLPARGKPTTNTIARKVDDPPTKRIDLAKLEKQIAMSSAGDQTKEVLALTANDAKTKVIDMSAHQAKTRVVDSSRLPRVPPGADASAADDDADSLTFTAPTPTGTPIRSAAPIGVVKVPSSMVPSVTPASVHQAATPPFATPIVRSTPSTPRAAVTTPVATPVLPTRTTPLGTPVVGARATPSGTAPPAKPPALPAVKRPPATPAPVVNRPPTEPPPSVVNRPPAESSPPPVAKAPTEPPPLTEPPKRPTPVPNAAELWARASATSAADESISELSIADALPVADEPAGTATNATESEPASPISTLFANQPARKHKPTPPPPHLDTLAKQIGGGDLPEGDFVYPIKRGGVPWLLKLVIALAVLGLGFFAFTHFYPMGDKPEQTAAVTPSEPTPAPVVEPPPPVAAPPTPENAAIEIETPTPEAPPSEATPPPSEAATSSVSPTTKPTTKPGSRTKPTSETKLTSETKPTGAVTKPTPDTTAAAESKPSAAPEPASDPSCDEVSCVLSKYDRPCCERYRPAGSFTPKNIVPDELDKAMVKAGIEKVKPKVVACGEKGGIKGTVKIALTVDGEGTVKNASVAETPDQALGECVARAMRNAKFGKSVKGGDFTYPFVF